jgi:hypothetical protein
MNRKLMFVFVVMLAILLPMTLVGQGKKGGGGGKKGMEAAPMSVTGCLNKGADADHFTLKDDQGKEYTVTGDSATLAKHANNHNVTITGTMGKENGKDVLKMGAATDLKMNSMCK